MTAPTTPDSRRDLIVRTLRATSAVAAVFTLVVLSLLATSAFQTARLDIVNLPALSHFQADYRADPRNPAIREQIRDLDLLARRAFFSSQDFISTGTILALVGALLFLVTSHAAVGLQWKIPLPDRPPDPAGAARSLRLTRLGVTVTGLGLALAALSLWLSQSAAPGQSARPSTLDSPAQPPAQTPLARPVPPATPGPDIWPSFRGPGGNGVAAVTHAPTAWDGPGGSNVLWKTGVPLPGFSSPIVVSNRVFLTGGTREAREVFAFDADSGQLLWRQPVTGLEGAPAETPDIDKEYGYASSTMATDGRLVFAIFATGDCVAFDRDGARIWGRNLGAPENHYAYASSLLVYGDLLIVQYDNKNDPRLMALATGTGAEVWSTPRSGIAWSSPICVDTGARRELILVSNPSVDAYDPATGEALWTLSCLDGEVAPSAAQAGDMIFVANDTASACGIRLPDAPGAKPTQVWSIDEKLPDIASPLADGARLYLATSGGIITCRSAATGKLLWEQDFTDGFHASPIRVGDHVYALDREGHMHIFKTANTFEPVATCPLGEPASGTPAFVSDRIYIRGEKHLFCVAVARNPPPP